jgi:hypothetical protein
MTAFYWPEGHLYMVKREGGSKGPPADGKVGVEWDLFCAVGNDDNLLLGFFLTDQSQKKRTMREVSVPKEDAREPTANEVQRWTHTVLAYPRMVELGPDGALHAARPIPGTYVTLRLSESDFRFGFKIPMKTGKK